LHLGVLFIHRAFIMMSLLDQYNSIVNYYPFCGNLSSQQP